MNRRTFLAMGTAAAAGLAGAQSIAVKKRAAAGAPNPVEGIAPVADGFNAAMPVWGDRIV